MEAQSKPTITISAVRTLACGCQLDYGAVSSSNILKDMLIRLKGQNYTLTRCEKHLYFNPEGI